MENNQNNKTIWVIIVILVLAGVAAWWLLQEESHDGAMMTEESGAMMEEKEVEGTMMMQEDADVPEGAMMEESGSMMEISDGASMSGSYEDYSSEKLAKANGGDVVLFFHASWCPTCRAADKAISAVSVPDGLTILKLNYDTETELRKKYGVTTQHTFVQVDADGNLVKKWTGSIDAAAIAAQTM